MKDPQSWIQIGGQAMSDRPKITPAENGPLLVEGVATMTSYGDGSIVDVGGKKALCRCGGSANKPFCDGTHATNGFQSARGEGRTSDRLEHYEGKGIVIHDNRGICSHAGHCTDALKSVFKLGEEPWIESGRGLGARDQGGRRELPVGGTELHHRGGRAKRLERADGTGVLAKRALRIHGRRRHRGRRSGRGREPRARDAVPLWSESEQALLRWLALEPRVRREHAVSAPGQSSR